MTPRPIEIGPTKILAAAEWSRTREHHQSMPMSTFSLLLSTI